MAHRVLVAPQITEKATLLEEQGKYVFKVKPNTTKSEIKKAIEQVYNVKVIGVNTTKSPRKRKRLGRSQGWVSGYKKAVVNLAKGQSIELMPR